MTSLPASLLEQLLGELSTLASVYHKPPESFVGRGRFGADEIQRAAIQEQRENAAENPIAAAAAAATGSGAGAGGAGASQNNIENLLDIDFDGAAPASSSDRQQQGGTTGSATATPDRVASPGVGGGGGMADMMGLFDAPAAPSGGGAAGAGAGANDIMNGFAGLDLGGSSQPPPASVQLGHQPQPQQQPQQQQQPKSGGANDDLLGLF